MGTGKQQISSVAMRVSSRAAELVIARVAPGEPVAQEAPGEPAAQEALAGPVAQEALAGPVAQEALAELAVLVAAELEIVLVAAVLVRDREGAELPHARVVAAATASVTVAHLHGLQLLAAVEDLAAAVAEIMREPVATGEAVAWAVAVTAVAEAADVAVE
jgi:hypothetical protein